MSLGVFGPSPRGWFLTNVNGSRNHVGSSAHPAARAPPQRLIELVCGVGREA